jgi:hypothetical protein
MDVKDFGLPNLRNGQLCDVNKIFDHVMNYTKVRQHEGNKENQSDNVITNKCVINLFCNADFHRDSDIEKVIILLQNSNIISMRFKFMFPRKVFNIKHKQIRRLLTILHDTINQRYNQYGPDFVIMINDVVGYDHGTYLCYNNQNQPCSERDYNITLHHKIISKLRNINLTEIQYPVMYSYIVKRNISRVKVDSILSIFNLLQANNIISTFLIKDEIDTETEKQFVSLARKLNSCYPSVVSIDVKFSIFHIRILSKYFINVVDWQTYDTVDDMFKYQITIQNHHLLV